jgi:hypothetical protein
LFIPPQTTTNILPPPWRSHTNRRPLTVTLGLKEHSLEAIKQLVSAVKDGGLLA